MGDCNGKELFESNKTLKEIFKGSDALISFKDLGPVVSQQFAYNCAYAGPVAIIMILYTCNKQIYG